MPPMPVTSELKGIYKREDLVFLGAPATLSELVRRCSRSFHEFLNLIAGNLGLAIEDAQELPSDRFGRNRRRLLDTVGVFVDELIDTNQRIFHGDGAILIHVNFAVVT